jgi:hypothetical protein
MTTMPQPHITRYFQLLNNRQFTAAQRTLKRIKQQTKKTQWNKGYYKALKGMLLAQKNNDNNYAFLSNLNPKDKPTLQQHKKEFQKHVQNRFHDDYDRGFFSAWHDYTRLLIKTLKEQAKPKTDNNGQTSITHYSDVPNRESMEH